jgi:hypothetical protein
MVFQLTVMLHSVCLSLNAFLFDGFYMYGLTGTNGTLICAHKLKRISCLGLCQAKVSHFSDTLVHC